MALKGSLTKCVLYAGDRWTINPKELILIGRHKRDGSFITLHSNDQSDSHRPLPDYDILPTFYGDLVIFKSLTKIAFSQLNLLEGPPV